MSKGVTSNAKIGVQKATNAETFLAGYAYVDEAGECVQSEAVTLTDSCGNEVLGPKPAASSIPVVATSLPSTLHLGEEIAVSSAAVLLIDANPNRTTALVQNTGSANIRVGPAGVTASTGLRVVPNQTVFYEEPNVNKDAIWGIREGTSDSVAFVQEETTVIADSATAITPPSCPTCKRKRHECECD